MEDNQCLFDEPVYKNTKLLPAAEAEKNLVYHKKCDISFSTLAPKWIILSRAQRS